MNIGDVLPKHEGCRRKQLRLQRALFGLSQSELAQQLGITFQQLQKYETGANRISASRLWEVGKILGVPVSYFFEGLDGKADPAADPEHPLVQSVKLAPSFAAGFFFCEMFGPADTRVQ